MPALAYHHRFEPGTDSAAAPLLLLHGTSGDEHDLISLGRTLSPGSALLSPRGDVLEHGARRFFARLAEGVFDPVEVTRRTQAMADFLTAAATQYALDLRRLTAVGFSNGANLAALLLQLRPETLGRAILFRPMVVLDRPAATGSLAGRRVLICSGRHDPIVPADHPNRLAVLLRAGGADVTVEVQPASHNLTARDLEIARDWLQ